MPHMFTISLSLELLSYTECLTLKTLRSKNNPFVRNEGVEKLEGQDPNVETWFSHITHHGSDKTIASSAPKEETLFLGLRDIAIIVKEERLLR